MNDPLSRISPSELVGDVLKRLGPPNLAAGGVVVGPASDAQQQLGVVSVVGAGLPVVERYVPVQWMRAQIRCLAGTLDEADLISWRVQGELHGRGRTLARMASTNRWYLIHMSNVTAGPSMHFDSAETWETLIFAEIMLGLDAVR